MRVSQDDRPFFGVCLSRPSLIGVPPLKCRRPRPLTDIPVWTPHHTWGTQYICRPPPHTRPLDPSGVTVDRVKSPSDTSYRRSKTNSRA